MKAKRCLKIIGVLILGFLLASCVSMTTEPPQNIICSGQDLNPFLEKGDYVKKVDNFLVIFDASSSMSGKQSIRWYKKQQKYFLADNLLKCMNESIPEIALNGGMRIFGPVAPEEGLIYGMTNYTKDGFNEALLSVDSTKGSTSIANAISQSSIDLEQTSGKTAVILVSDGLSKDPAEAVAAAAAMKDKYGDKVCISTVLLGDNRDAKATMNAIAENGKCDFAVSPDGRTLLSTNAMTDFVIDVFLTKAVKSMPPQDSDGDGVTDAIDQCPNTPKGAKIDKVGCPIPLKEKVSITLHIEFDYDKDAVRPEYHSHIEKVADFLKAYPETNAILEGHTDSIGNDEYNIDLSNRRAMSVKKYLIDKFETDGARISTVGYGESKPIATNDTAEDRQKNRRVVANIMTITIK
jgi:OOP family OmpA-OmpF porin